MDRHGYETDTALNGVLKALDYKEGNKSMQYRNVGRSGLKVSEISLGSWLTYGGTVAGDQARACILKAYELGVNLFDTSDAYYRGEAEKVLGEVLPGFPRTSYVLATKVFFPVGSGPN